MSISSSPLMFPSIRKRHLISHSFNVALNLPRRRASALAREVRNPLTCIDLSIDMLKSAVTDPELKVYMEIIKKSSKRINQLMTELLECQEIGPVSQTHY
jgi:signal transduction histidine kinase